MEKIDPKMKRLLVQNINYQKIICDLEHKLRVEKRKSADLTNTLNRMKRDLAQS